MSEMSSFRPYYTNFSEAHEAFYEVAGDVAGLSVKDPLNAYLPENLKREYLKHRTIFAEIKLLSHTEGGELVDKLRVIAERRGAVLLHDKQDIAEVMEKPDRRHLKLQLGDGSVLMASCNSYPGDRTSRVRFEARIIDPVKG